jgi:deazaflavin-dependent oxidoreductase (nitroreductase family)
MAPLVGLTHAVIDALARDFFRNLNKAALPAVKAGLGSPLPLGFGLVLLETTGRRSGLTREVPVVGFRVGDRITVSTVRDNSQWLANLEANPAAGVWVNGKRRDVSATVTRGPLNTVTLAPT